MGAEVGMAAGVWQAHGRGGWSEDWGGVGAGTGGAKAGMRVGVEGGPEDGAGWHQTGPWEGQELPEGGVTLAWGPELEWGQAQGPGLEPKGAQELDQAGGRSRNWD